MKTHSLNIELTQTELLAIKKLTGGLVPSHKDTFDLSDAEFDTLTDIYDYIDNNIVLTEM